jgi:hypothetical protein
MFILGAIPPFHSGGQLSFGVRRAVSFGCEVILGLFKWFERKVFLGDVIKDYGVLDEKYFGIGRLRTSVVLCRRRGQLRLAIRTSGVAPLGASVNYALIDATPIALAKLAKILQDAQELVIAEEKHA